MSRIQFNSNNKVGQEITFTTEWNTGFTHTTGFGPVLTMNGAKRVHWDFGVGDSYFAGNSPSYYYTDTGTTKSVKIKTNRLSDIKTFTSIRDRITGHLDLRGIDLGGDFRVNNSPNLGAITHSYSNRIFTNYSIRDQFIGGNPGSNFITNLDVSMFPNLGGFFRVVNCPLLTGVTHTGSSQIFTYYQITGAGLIGNHNLSMFPNLGGVFQMFGNQNLTGVTHTGSSQIFTIYDIQNCNITGNHNLSMFPNLGGTFSTANNPLLTSITHTGSTRLFTTYNIQNCNITGEHDISMLTNLSGTINFFNNSLLTGLTRSSTNNIITTYNGQNCNLIGNHDMTIYPNLSNFFRLNANNNLTGVTHTATTQTFIEYNLGGCDITGNHDLTMIPNIGGRFNMSGNPNLTGVTHSSTPSNVLFKATLGGGYYLGSCNITGNHDLSMFHNFGSDVPNTFTLSQECKFQMDSNPNLTGVTFVSSGTTNYISRFHIYNCDITGNLDLSIFPNLYGSIITNNNQNLTGVTLPNSTGIFRDTSTAFNTQSTALGFIGCNIPYIDFRPLSGATMDVNSVQGCRIRFNGNGITASNVNRILTELSGITYNNLNRWSGVTAFIGGTNATPDGSSGGYDGLAAVNYLTGATPTGGGWTIII
jgi:hypothetical protein